MTWTTATGVFLVLLLGSAKGRIREKRIVNGRSTSIEDFPYQVSLRERGHHICGGSIVSKQHILTAAHCVDRKNFLNMLTRGSFLKVHTGTNSRIRKGSVYIIGKIDVHPGWFEGKDNDVAVITLRKSIKFNRSQNKISLPIREVEYKTEGIVTGWGQASNRRDSAAEYLQELRVLVENIEECSPKLGREYSNEYICTSAEGGSGSCYGDSGGPLVANDAIVGIVSGSESERCATGTPDLYTNVYHHKEWIESIIGLAS